MDTSAGIIVGRPFGGTVILYIGYRPPLKSLMQDVGAFVPWLFTQTLDLSYAVMYTCLLTTAMMTVLKTMQMFVLNSLHYTQETTSHISL